MPTTPPPSEDRNDTVFPALPVELREMIYPYILTPGLCSVSPLRAPYHMNKSAYALLSVNRGTRLEAGLFYLRERTFNLQSTPLLALFQHYLDTFPDELGYEAVRHLELYKFHDRAYNSFLARCVNLKTVTLWFDSHDERIGLYSAGVFETHRLATLCQLVCLKEVRLKWFFGWRAVGDSLMRMEVAGDAMVLHELDFAEEMGRVEDRLRRGFEERGLKEVKVVICMR
jgi:hypothetical protein